MMITPIAMLAALTLAAVSSPLGAQGRTQKQAVISPSNLKAMTSQKSRSKKPMTERAGMKRASKVAADGRTSPSPAPTSVRGVKNQ